MYKHLITVSLVVVAVVYAQDYGVQQYSYSPTTKACEFPTNNAYALFSDPLCSVPLANAPATTPLLGSTTGPSSNGGSRPSCQGTVVGTDIKLAGYHGAAFSEESNAYFVAGFGYVEEFIAACDSSSELGTYAVISASNNCTIVESVPVASSGCAQAVSEDGSVIPDTYVSFQLTCDASCAKPLPTSSVFQCSEPNNNEWSQQCEWYPLCMAATHNCAGSPSEYAMSYGFKFCSKFTAAPANDAFTSAGRVWRDAVLQCLQNALVPILTETESCSDLHTMAFSSHPVCYTKPVPAEPSISICAANMVPNWPVVLTTVGTALFSKDSYTQVRTTILTCLKYWGSAASAEVKKLGHDLDLFSLHVQAPSAAAVHASASDTLVRVLSQHVGVPDTHFLAVNVDSAPTAREDEYLVRVLAVSGGRSTATAAVAALADPAVRAAIAADAVVVQRACLGDAACPPEASVDAATTAPAPVHSTAALRLATHAVLLAVAAALALAM